MRSHGHHWRDLVIERLLLDSCSGCLSHHVHRGEPTIHIHLHHSLLIQQLLLLERHIVHGILGLVTSELWDILVDVGVLSSLRGRAVIHDRIALRLSIDFLALLLQLLKQCLVIVGSGLFFLFTQNSQLSLFLGDRILNVIVHRELGANLIV